MMFSFPKGRLRSFRCVDHLSFNTLTDFGGSGISWMFVQTFGAKAPISNSSHSFTFSSLNFCRLLGSFQPGGWIPQKSSRHHLPSFHSWPAHTAALPRWWPLCRWRLYCRMSTSVRLTRTKFNISFVDHSLQTLNSSQHLKIKMLKELQWVREFFI